MDDLITVQLERGTVAEYIAALKSSGKFGPQVRAHRIIAAIKPATASDEFLAPELQALLRDIGVQALYTHQQEAIRQVLTGIHTGVATPTASGKSLIYILPVLNTLLHDPEAKALFLFPLKALAQDQRKTISALWSLLPGSLHTHPQPVAIYDGDTTGHRRRVLRQNPPPILITNPDMLHLSLLPYHERWAHFWTHLRHVVIDEMHTYRGIFGSHVAWVMRRLRRLCAFYGANPTFILASATIGNPEEHGQRLLDAPVTAVTRSGAANAVRNIILLNPLDSAATCTVQLLEAAINRGLRTIVYCQSRRMTELITIWTEQRLKEHRGKIASYRSGFLPEERRTIEDRLNTGSLLGVITTSALELGIDIGNLDICLLVGYPGSMMATWQRAGRVGRSGQESLIVFIGHEDALDQHFMRHPEDFFSRPVEPVTMNPDNPHIADDQLVCAAAELPLTVNDPLLRDESTRALVTRLTAAGQLLQSAEGSTWFSHRTYPQRLVSLRGGGASLVILEQPDRRPLGEIDAHRAFRECHPGAIYLHMARSFHIDSLDLEGREILATPVHPPYFTRVLSEKNTEIEEVRASLRYGSSTIHFGTLRVTERIVGYHKIAQGSLRIIARVPLNLPPQTYTTEGFWIVLPAWLQKKTEATQMHFMGGIHAMEHALIGVMPLEVLCDRNDLGGISHPWHPQVAGPAVFVYDGYAGGMGLTRKAFASMPRLLEQTWQLVNDCPCDLGCPSCVHSPKCGSGNRPIDKQACLFLLDQLRTAGDQQKNIVQHRSTTTFIAKKTNGSALPLPEKVGVFDLETQHSAQEVGGWHRADLMRVSVAVLYESEGEEFTVYTEATIDQLISRLFKLDLVIGFNNKRFDNKVLSAYSDQDLGLLPSFDLLEVISEQLGYRLSLQRLAEKTLKVNKEGDGLEALRWFRQGEMAKLVEYCRKDVEITRDLFYFGLRQRHLLFQNKAGKEVRLPVDFAQSMQAVLERHRLSIKAKQSFYAPNR